MPSYPIWNEIKSCLYKKDKSYGIRQHNMIKSFIGTSKKNSHEFAEIEFNVRETPQGKLFQLLIDDNVIKTALFKDIKKEPEIDIWYEALTPMDLFIRNAQSAERKN
tara:strand:- start:137 stop:457 length:321 start_codon:yes stop_codon:yes gene_type:complete